MSSPPDTEFSQSAAPAAGSRAMEDAHPSSWRSALLCLIASRSTLVQLESKDAARIGARRGLLLIAVLICAFFTWALLLAGGIAAIAQISGWRWHWVALAIAAAHLAAAILFARAAKKPTPPTFPVTRAEFQKDREWIENFQKTRKSKD